MWIGRYITWPRCRVYIMPELEYFPTDGVIVSYRLAFENVRIKNHQQGLCGGHFAIPFRRPNEVFV